MTTVKKHKELEIGDFMLIRSMCIEFVGISMNNNVLVLQGKTSEGIIPIDLFEPEGEITCIDRKLKYSIGDKFVNPRDKYGDPIIIHRIVWLGRDDMMYQMKYFGTYTEAELCKLKKIDEQLSQIELLQSHVRRLEHKLQQVILKNELTQ